MDMCLVSFFETLFAEGAYPSHGSRTMAALCHFLPANNKMTICFPRAMRSLRGWERLRPPLTRQPLSYYGLMILCCQLLAANDVAMALA
eukprot:12421405-Karenia_brevis.AAC.1